MPKRISLAPSELLEYINRYREVSYTQLCRHFKYSLPVIRRMCQELQRKNPIQCKHGKVVAGSYGLSFIISSPIHEEEKRQIAQKASLYIQDGETIYLGAGSTVAYLCEYLPRFQHLTVITNSLLVVSKLIDFPNITTVSLGGIVQKNTLSITGEYSNTETERLKVSKVFLTTEGFTLEDGGTCNLVEKNMFDPAFAHRYKNVFLLADSSKFGLSRPVLWLPLEDINTVISDRYLPPHFKEGLNALGISLILV